MIATKLALVAESGQQTEAPPPTQATKFTGVSKPTTVLICDPEAAETTGRVSTTGDDTDMIPLF